MTQQEPTVAEIMMKAVLAVDIDTNVRECSRAMAKRGVSCSVITQANRAIGIVTERDLVSKVLADAFDPTKVYVKDIMSTPLITISPNASLTDAAAQMAEYRVRRLVVVDRTGSMVGIITAGDIARSLAEKHGYREATFNALARYKEGAESGPYQ
ncbi:MAG: CBS domain-containing protein [Nitrososphaerales archaeon]|jgi:CBS domain-containing protein